MEEIVETPEGTEVPEAVVVADDSVPAARRGRPRPDAVIQRDNTVFDAIIGPMTRKQVAERVGIPESHAYLSLLRLRNDGRVRLERTGTGYAWSRVPSAVPAELPAETAV